MTDLTEIRSPDRCYWHEDVQDMGSVYICCRLREKHGDFHPVGYEDCDNCPEHHDKNKKTEGDKVREMSDPELAELFMHIMSGGCPVQTSKCSERCKECWVSWLRQVSEE